MPGVSFFTQGFVSTMSVHGSANADQQIFFDGMNIGQNLTGSGGQANGVGVNELAQTESCTTRDHKPRKMRSAACAWIQSPRKAATNSRGRWRNFGAFQGDNVTHESSCTSRPAPSSISATKPTGGLAAAFSSCSRNDLRSRTVSRPLPTLYFPEGGVSETGGSVSPHSTI